MDCVAIIPARGGSKGVPRKNVRPLAGKPLLAHVVEQACRAKSLSRVLVSTDDLEIAQIATQFGAEVVERPAEFSGDTASSEAAVLHALDVLNLRHGEEPEITVMLQCTSPLTTAEDIDGTVGALLSADADTALAVTPFYHFLWRQAADGNAEGINHDKSFRLRRQDMEPQYLETGAVYAMRTSGFRTARHRFFGRTALYVMPPERVQEIDDPLDFAKAEVMIRARDRNALAARLPNRLAAIVLDFDGVFTDNRVLVTEIGEEAVLCDRSDGLGLEMLVRHGVQLLVLSKESNPVVSARCRKLNVECIQSLEDKKSTLFALAMARGYNLKEVIYVGNDQNDVACMMAVGCSVCPSDAHPSAQAAAAIILTNSGGRGAIRELCDLILERLDDGSLTVGGQAVVC